MAKLGEQLQQERPTRTQRVGEQQRVEKVRRLQGIERQRIKTKVDTASATMQNISYEDYETEYNKLDQETKQYFTTPTALKQTEGYKTYQIEKAEYDKQVVKYNAQLKVQQEAQRESAEWERVYTWLHKKNNRYHIPIGRSGNPKRYDPRTSFGRKVNKVIDHQTEADISRKEQQALALEKQGITPTPPSQDPMSLIPFGKVGEPRITTPQQDYLLSLVSDSKIPQKDFSSKGGVYDVKSGMFQIPSEPSGQATAISRVPTQSEQKAIDFADIKAKDTFSSISSGYKYVDERVHFDLKGTSSPKLSISFGKVKEPTPVEKTFELGITKLGDVKGDVFDWAIGKGRVKDLDLSMDKEFQEKYQSEYETSGLTPTQFEQSTKAIILQKDFQEKYSAEYKALSQDTSFVKKILGGTAYTGLSIGQLGLGLTKTPTKVVATGVGIYTGVNVLKLIPSFVQTTAGIGLTAYGGYKTFSPTSTIEETGAGVLMFATGGISLGYAGVKALSRQTLIRVVEKPNIASYKKLIKGYETRKVFDVTFKGTTQRVEQVAFGKQKYLRMVSDGSRVKTSRVWRDLLRKYTPLKPDYIYKGYPTQQLGKTYNIKSLSKDYVYKTPSVYQKELKVLMKQRKLTISQAKSQLRFHTPKVVDVKLSSGIKNIFEQQARATGEFKFITEQKAISYGDGLKTRGKKSITDVYKIDEQLVGEIKISQITKTTQDAKLIAQGKSTTTFLRESVGKAGDIKTGYMRIGQKISTPVKYQDLFEVSSTKQIVPLKRAIQYAGSRTQLIKRTDRVVQQIDLDELMGVSYKSKYGLTPAKITKTPLSKTFGSKDVLDDIKKIINKKPSIQISKLLPEQSQVNIQQLKSAITPDVKPLTKVKDLIKIKQLDKITGIKMGATVSTKALLDLKTDLKMDTKLKTNLKSITNLKDLLKDKTILKMKQAPALKTAPALRSDLKLKQSLKQLTGLSLKTPAPIKIPRTPIITTPKIVIPFMLKGAIKDQLKKKKKGQFSEFALLPDFTSRAIGLKPDIISGKQAQARIRKILTGMEVRRGVIIQ